MQPRHHRAQALDLLAQLRVLGGGALERGALRAGQLAEQVGGDVLAGAHAPSSSSIIRRRRRSARTMRIFTVPSGIPVASAISLWERPS